MSFRDIMLQGTDYRFVNDEMVNITTAEGQFYCDVWGEKSKDQQYRRQEFAHLDRISGDGFHYNLENFDECTAFMNDILDGKLDGQANVRDGSVDITGSRIVVGGTNASYDLHRPEDMARLRADNADGKIDGHIGGGSTSQAPIQACSAEAPPPSVCPSEAAAAPTPTAPADSGSQGTSGPTAAPSAAPSGNGPVQSDDKATQEMINQIGATKPEELRQQLMNGTLSKDIMNSPAAMQMVMYKLQEYARMMEMVTNMIKANHETLMAIARNIKP